MSNSAIGIRAAALVIPSINDFRLTTESGVPISTSDRTSQGTIYLAPFRGNHLSTYDSGVWTDHAFSQISLALTATSGKNYDVFVYNNSGTMTLVLSSAWTDDTTRADAVTTQDGVYVLSSDHSRRLVGTIRASGSNVVADSEANRYVANVDNLMPRRLRYVETGQPTTTSTTWASWGASANVNFVIPNTGRHRCQVWAVGVTNENNTSNGHAFIGLGLDSTSSAASYSNTAEYGFAGSHVLHQRCDYDSSTITAGKHTLNGLFGVANFSGSTQMWLYGGSNISNYGDGNVGINGYVWI